MTRDEFNASMKQILVFFRRPRTEDEVTDFRLYMDGLYPQVSYMKAALFDRTCFELAGDLRDDDGKPRPARFQAIYAGLEERERNEGVVVGLAPAMTPEENLERMIQAAKLISPDGARASLALAAKMKLSLPPEVIAILEEKVPPAPSSSPPAETPIQPT